ncbi:hypothetical protein ACVXZZ_12915 [Staphylococcus aureus]
MSKVRQDILDAIENTNFKVNWGKTHVQMSALVTVANGLFLVNVCGVYRYQYFMLKMAKLS